MTKALTLKKKLVIVASVIVLGVIGGISSEMANQGRAKADTSPLVTEVDQHGDKLKNHEARIGNLEGDTKDLQDKTTTPPSTTRVEVPVVREVTAPSQTSSTQTSQPVPVTVTAFREIVIDADTSDCEYTYSDGTTYRFAWKTTNSQGAWITDGQGNNGHWQKSTNTNGICNNSVIGQAKV